MILIFFCLSPRNKRRQPCRRSGTGVFRHPCDMITNITAQHMGINSVLITSGKESICRALETAIQLVYNQERLREENLFFRELINRQLSATMLFEEDGTLFLSTLQGLRKSFSPFSGRRLHKHRQGPNER